MLKPHVVFFGESLPRPRSDLTTELAGESDVMVVAGTSLAVWSAFRLVRMAEKNGCEIIVVTRGPTRADELVKPELRFRCESTPAHALSLCSSIALSNRPSPSILAIDAVDTDRKGPMWGWS